MPTSLFRIAPMQRFRLGAASELVYFSPSRTAKTLPTHVVDALSSRLSFSPLEDHARALSSLVDRPLALLEELRTLGGLLSLDDLMASARGQCSATLVHPRITCITIPTNGRVRELEAALDSYIPICKPRGRDFRFFIADDSPISDRQKKTRTIVENSARSSKVPIHYAGYEEKENFVEALASVCDVPRDIIEFALLPDPHCPITIGANRNAVLLHTVGELLLSADDDTICRSATAATSIQRSALIFGNDLDFAEVRFFKDRRAALRFVKDVDMDVIDEHETLLGRSLLELIVLDRHGTIKFNNTCNHLIENMYSGQGAIRMTYCGVVGDSGMDSSESIGIHPGLLTRQWCTTSEEAYRESIVGREIVRQFFSPTITHTGAPMTTAVGIDNRWLLPPFFPKFRNEDGIFAATLRRCTQSAFFGHLPFVLTHNPLDIRRNRPNYWATVRISDYIIQCILSWPEPIGSSVTEKRMKSLGNHLVEIASQASGDFNETMRVLLLARSARTIEHLEALLLRFQNKPDFWAQDLRLRIDEISHAMMRPTVSMPSDMENEPRAFWNQSVAQSLVMRYGQLLYSWPEIVAATLAISKRGVRLGRRL